MSYCIYLRKSRSDTELEKVKEFETLKRHETILLSLAKSQNLKIDKVYREMVSGDTISQRPEMQNLLQDVSACVYEGVLVVEIERLARGNTIDQGVVAETFKLSNTKIITPLKTYDPNNDFDEEFFEFGLFMARREYKMINRRLQSGRLSSINEGKYVGSVPPYGYDKIKLPQKGYSLTPNKDQSKIVKLIFDLYTFENLGISKVAKYLNNTGIKPIKTDLWVNSSIQSILKNPVYIGKIKWNARPIIKVVENGVTIKKRPRNKEFTLIDGIHKPIIDEDIFKKAQIMLENNKISPKKINKSLKNPLAGIVKCGLCGRTMIRRPYKNGQQDVLMCPLSSCKNISSELSIVEEKIWKMMELYLNQYKTKFLYQNNNDTSNNKEHLTKSLKNLNSEKIKLQLQLNKLHDFLEQGIYTPEIFSGRSKKINFDICEINYKISNIEKEILNKSNKKNKAPIKTLNNLNDIYKNQNNVKLKNNLLKEFVKFITYYKDINCRWNGELDDFQLIVYPKVPI